jgi:hypothetical protein
MPLGWGRTVGSYLGSHFGSLGRPPNTKKGILQLCNNDQGLSSSSQLQNNNFEDRKSICNSADSSNAENDERNSSENHHNCISDGVTETNYARSIQIGALLALAYNLFSANLRIRSIQGQKPILIGNTNKRELFLSERQNYQHRQCNEHANQGITFTNCITKFKNMYYKISLL